MDPVPLLGISQVLLPLLLRTRTLGEPRSTQVSQVHKYRDGPTSGFKSSGGQVFFTPFNIHSAANYAVCSKIINSIHYIIIIHMYIILFTSDPTLTPENILVELQEVQLWGKNESGLFLNMPRSTHDDLIRRHGDGAQGKSALVNEYLSQHPYPRWGQIVRLLERREKTGKARAGLAREVKDKYMTSEYTIP